MSSENFVQSRLRFGNGPAASSSKSTCSGMPGRSARRRAPDASARQRVSAARRPSRARSPGSAALELPARRRDSAPVRGSRRLTVDRLRPFGRAKPAAGILQPNDACDIVPVGRLAKGDGNEPQEARTKAARQAGEAARPAASPLAGLGNGGRWKLVRSAACRPGPRPFGGRQLRSGVFRQLRMG